MADTRDIVLEGLYDAYNESLFRYAAAITGSTEDAEDAVQVVFVRLSRQWKCLVRIDNIKAYLFRAVRNAAYSILRSKHRRKYLYESACAEFQANRQTKDSERLAEARMVCEALYALPVEQREVLILKIFDEMTFKEIADTINTSLNTVASRYRYGIEKLRKVLEMEKDG